MTVSDIQLGIPLLIEVARHAFSARIRKSDTLARIGGDEFHPVILSSLHVKEEAMMVGRTLLDTLLEPFDIDGHQLMIRRQHPVSSIYPERPPTISSEPDATG